MALQRLQANLLRLVARRLSALSRWMQERADQNVSDAPSKQPAAQDGAQGGTQGDAQRSSDDTVAPAHWLADIERLKQNPDAFAPMHSAAIEEDASDATAEGNLAKRPPADRRADTAQMQTPWESNEAEAASSPRDASVPHPTRPRHEHPPVRPPMSSNGHIQNELGLTRTSGRSPRPFHFSRFQWRPPGGLGKQSQTPAHFAPDEQPTRRETIPLLPMQQLPSTHRPCKETIARQSDSQEQERGNAADTQRSRKKVVEKALSPASLEPTVPPTALVEPVSSAQTKPQVVRLQRMRDRAAGQPTRDSEPMAELEDHLQPAESRVSSRDAFERNRDEQRSSRWVNLTPQSALESSSVLEGNEQQLAQNRWPTLPAEVDAISSSAAREALSTAGTAVSERLCKRRRRLDQEQRGKLWNESLF